MIEFRHKLAVYFLLFLSPFIKAKESKAGYELVESDTEVQHILPSDRLLMFGEIQMSTSAWEDKDCMLDIIVEIGEKTWKQQLNSSSFAFQVPVRSFFGMIGMISIHEHEGKRLKLWSHFFIVKDLGVQRLYGTLSGDCTRITNPGSSLIPWIPAMCPFLRVMENTRCLDLYTRSLTDLTSMCPTCLTYVDNICNITGAIEIYSAAAYEHKSYSRIVSFMKTLKLYIRNWLRPTIESSDWHLVFGVYLLQTWHFHCLGMVYLLLYTTVWFLRISESACTTAVTKFELPADDCPPYILNRKRQTSCPNSSTSFSSLSRQGLMLSGSDIFFHEPWGADAHQYYYNRTAGGNVQSGTFSDVLDQLDSDHSVNSERWSRDRNGRLIRHRLV